MTESRPHYSFRQLYIPSMDLMLTEIIKPDTSCYTLLTYRYNEEDHGRSIFTDIWVSRSWGTCRADFEFLQELWTHLRIDDQPLNMDDLMNWATNQCVPAAGQIPRAPPRVYRRTLHQVLEQVLERHQLDEYVDTVMMDSVETSL